jgi:hypothetical protein
MSAATADAARKPFVGELLGRGDFAIISELVEPNSKVLIWVRGRRNAGVAGRKQGRGSARRQISATKVRAHRPRRFGLPGRY